jgi:hypothetical protein
MTMTHVSFCIAAWPYGLGRSHAWLSLVYCSGCIAGQEPLQRATPTLGIFQRAADQRTRPLPVSQMRMPIGKDYPRYFFCYRLTTCQAGSGRDL